jgi:hypothetical protein
MTQQSAQCFIGIGACSDFAPGAVEQIVAPASGSSSIASAQLERTGESRICSAKATRPIQTPVLIALRDIVKPSEPKTAGS